MSRPYRLFMSVLVIAYLAVGVASHHRKTELGKAIYRPLRGLQTTLCLWQNWGMFAPAPVSSSWLLFTGVTQDGTEIALDPLAAPPEPPFFRWRYSRRNKLSMSGLNRKRKALHRGLVQHYCALQREEGVHLKEVTITRYKRMALRPNQALRKNRPKQKEQRSEVGTYRCR